MIYPDFSVNGIDHYPYSLRRPNRAGKTFNRTPETIENYRYRFKLLERRAHKMVGAEQPLELSEILKCITWISVELAENTWNQYQAASMQALRDHFDLQFIDEYEAEKLVTILDRHTDFRSERTEKPPTRKRTSSGRAKWIDLEEIDLIGEALMPNDLIDGALYTINEFGDRVGLRLTEWLSCYVTNRRLIVKNAKYCEINEKGLAPCRVLNLKNGFCDGEICVLDLGLQRIADLVSRFEINELKTMLHHRLCEVADGISPGRKITFRTYRDQFRANMEADGHCSQTIGGAMGHSSADSRFRYGVKRRGRKGIGLAACTEELAAMVRPGANTSSRLKRRANEKAADLKIEELKARYGEDWVSGMVNRAEDDHLPKLTPFG